MFVKISLSQWNSHQTPHYEPSAMWQLFPWQPTSTEPAFLHGLRCAGKEGRERACWKAPAADSSLAILPPQGTKCTRERQHFYSLAAKTVFAPTVNQLLGHLQVGWFACFVNHSQCTLFPKQHGKLLSLVPKSFSAPEGNGIRQLGHALKCNSKMLTGDISFWRRSCVTPSTGRTTTLGPPLPWAAWPVWRAGRVLVSSLPPAAITGCCAWCSARTNLTLPLLWHSYTTA